MNDGPGNPTMLQICQVQEESFTLEFMMDTYLVSDRIE